MQIQDDPLDYQMPEEENNQLYQQSTIVASQIINHLLSINPSDCLQVIAKMAIDDSSIPKFKHSIEKISPQVLKSLFDKLNDKLQTVIINFTQSFKEKSIQGINENIVSFFNVLKKLYYDEKIMTPTRKVQEAAIAFMLVCICPNIFLNTIGQVNSILSRRHAETHKKFGSAICWPLYSWMIKKEQSQDKPNLAVSDNIGTLDQETKLILKFQLIRGIMASKVPQIQVPEEDVESIVLQLRQKPYQKLLKYVIKYRKMHQQCSRITDQLYSCSLKFQSEKSPPKYEFKGNYLHQDLLNAESLTCAIKQTGPQYLRFFNSESFFVNGNVVYSKYNLQMLQQFYKKANNDQEVFQVDVLYAIAQNFRKLVQNSQKNLKIVGCQGTMMETEQNLMPEVLCRTFNILSGYYNAYINESSSIPSQGFINESTLNQFIKKLVKWVQEERFAKLTQTKVLVENLLAFMIYLSYRRTFHNILDWDSAISNSLVEILKKTSPLNSSWIAMRNLKGLVNKWIKTLATEDLRYKDVMQIFFEIIFDEKTVIPIAVDRKTRIFSSIQVTKSNMKIISEQTLKQLARLKYMLQQNQKNQNIYQYQESEKLMQKILILVNIKQRSEQQKISKELAEIYWNYANFVPSIYHFRTYIAEIYKKSEAREALIETKSKTLFEMYKKVRQYALMLNAQQWVSSINKLRKQQLKQFFRHFRHFKNMLQLKNSSNLELPSNYYIDVIQFLKDVWLLICQGKNKIISAIKKDPIKMKKLLKRDPTNQNQYSFYSLFETSFSDLKNVFRCYLCNADKMLKKNEQYLLMREIGEQIFLKIERHSEMQQVSLYQHVKDTLNLISLLNQLLGNDNIRGKTYLERQQIQQIQLANRRGDRGSLQNTLMYRSEAIQINLLSSFYSHGNTRQSFFEVLKNIFANRQSFKNLPQISSKQIAYEVKPCMQEQLLKYCQQTCKQKTDDQVEIQKRKSSSIQAYQDELQLLLEYVFLPKIQTLSTGVYLCDQLNNSAQDQIALGLIFDQINRMHSKLSSDEIINLEKYFDIFGQNLNTRTLISKKSEVEQQDIENPFRRRLSQRRDRERNNLETQRIRLQLLTMNLFPLQAIQVALESNTFYDTGQALDWLNQNQGQVERILLQKSSQRSMIDSRQNISEKRETQYKGERIQPLDQKSFIQKFEKVLKDLIRNVLLPNIFKENGKSVKSMLFVCLNSFSKADFKSKQYSFFAQKMFKQLNELKQIKQQQEKRRFDIILSIIENSLKKQPKVIISFVSNNIGVKMMSRISQVQLEQGQKILSIINSTLPATISAMSEQTQLSYKKYMHFICNSLINYPITSSSVSEILFKIAGVKDEQLMRKVSQVVCSLLSKGFLNSNIFPLIQLLIEGDKTFVQANMELDIKGFILQNYGYKSKKTAGKDHSIQLDLRQFAIALRKYEGKTLFAEVSKKFLAKKKNKNRFLYYNFKQHDLLQNQTLNIQNHSFKPSETIRFIVDSLVNLMVEHNQKDSGKEIQKQAKISNKYYAQELQKVLDYYKLLIPYTVTRRIVSEKVNRQVLGEQNDLISWLINRYSVNTEGSALSFLEFLMMKNNLFIKKPASEMKIEGTQNEGKGSTEITTFSEYICSRVVYQLAVSNARISKQVDFNTYWSTFLILFFMQIKSFNQKSRCPFSVENPTSLVSILQNSISKIVFDSNDNSASESDPVIYTLKSQCLYLIHKWRMIKNLSKTKYKLVEGGQNQIEKQYLPMDLFYGNDIMDNWKNKSVNGKASHSLTTRNRTHQNAFVVQRDGQIQIRLNPGDNEMGENQLDQMEEQEDDHGQMDMQRINFRRVPGGQDFADSQRNIISIFQPIQTSVPIIQAQSIQPQRINSEILQNAQRPRNELLHFMQQDSQMRDESEENIPNQLKTQEKKQEELEEQIFIEEQAQYLIEIMRIFLPILKSYENLKAQSKQPKIDLLVPDLPIKLTQTPNCKVTINQPQFSLEFSSSKTKIFQQRISQIYKLIYAKKEWIIPGEAEKKNLHIRLGQALLGDRMRDLGGDMIHHIERLLNRRHQQEEAQQNRQRPLNMNQIVGRLQQYVQPVQIVQSIANQIKEPQSKPQNQMVAQEKSVKNQEKSEQVPKVQEKMEVELEKKEQKQQKVAQKMQIEPKKQQEKPKVEQKQQQNPANEQAEQKLEEEPNQRQMVAQSNQREPEAPQRHRQVLDMMGLPQTFLHDAGLDPQFFDCLPDDLQMEQITQYLRDQEQMRAQNQNNNGNPQASSLNDNAAFFASVDPSLRAQLLLEATPEVLATLPPQMRAQAENVRQRQISMMIQQEQEEQQLNFVAHKAHTKLETKNLKFPEVPLCYFPKVSATLPEKLFRTVFININASNDNKFKIMGYRFLLENRLTREKALTTLISLLRQESFTHSQSIIQCSIHESKEQKEIDKSKLNKWNFQKVEISQNVKKFREGVLKLIFDCMKTSAYKDQKFLQRKISIKGFEKYQVTKNKELITQGQQDTYDPQLELLDLGLSNHKSLAIQIIKTLSDQKIGQLPNYLLDKIVLATKRDKLPASFYDHLGKLSENQQMKRLFLKYFPETSPPKIQLLASLLKYKFAQLPYLSKIHEEAISSYNPNYNEFLNQIFSIYSKQDLKNLEPFLLKHKNVHFQIIKHLYAQGRSLESEPLGIILKFPTLLDFQSKKFLFRKHPKIRRAQGKHRLAVQVSRQNIFRDSYNQIMARTPRELMGRLQVTFIDEPGYDAGGIAREWFQCLSKEIFNPNYALFQHSSSGNTYQPNPKSYVNADHLKYFKFIGRFVGKALAEGMLIDSYFTRAVYKIILGQQLEFQDLEQQDYAFYKSMKWMKENAITGIIDQTFSYQYDHFGHLTIKQLMPGGRTIQVTQQNKQEYIQKYCLSKMRDNFATQMNSLLEGFHDIIPQQCISFFEAKQLELLISGLPSIDIQDLKKNTDYSGYTPTDQVIMWYWEIVEGYSQDQLAKLVQFVTGTSRIPAGGFSQLQGMNGLQRISIHKDPNAHQLPKAHTCFNQLDLPNYHSKDILKERLRIAITEGHEGFGFI